MSSADEVAPDITRQPHRPPAVKVPGHNVDRIDIDAGLDYGTELGFDSAEDEMVTEYALARHARGEEEGAERTWLSYHPKDLTSWRMILATAMAAAQ